MVAPKTLLTTSAIALGAGITGITPAAALSIPTAVQPLLERAELAVRGKADILKGFLELIGIVAFKDAPNLWEFDKLPDFCKLHLETTDGGGCFATVECKDGGEVHYNKDRAGWNSCFVGGRQFFTDPRLDGTEGEGLTDPVVQLKEFHNWKEIDVTGLSDRYEDMIRCEAGITPLNCAEGPFVCRWDHNGNTYVHQDRTKRWKCGVPKPNAKFPDDVNWEVNTKRDLEGGLTLPTAAPVPVNRTA
ncbi:fibronectin type iii domain-containing protein [Podospora australis]|uniref:Fibronectin type iii domain-containing protein n=1 Tax=Podospora australis TaxID=1536484 RepID=A0AAN7AEW6_9PEZI|nr:fibronectin type iii domain-containing protein [Podospora australis]